MNAGELIKTYLPFVKSNFLPLIFGLAGLMFLSYGLISLLTTQNTSSDTNFDASSSSIQGTQPDSQKISVDIEGAVVKSGVYKFSQDSIIQDVLIASGGLSSNADRDWIAKNVNLAQKISDGEKIYIPSKTDNYSSSNSILGTSAQNTSQLININNATEGDLDSLPGIGPVTAQKIISGRPYSGLNDLLDKKIVGSKVFDEIKDKISVY